MKKIFAIILTLSILGSVAVPTFAQGRRRNQTYYGSSARTGSVYDSRSYYDYRNRSFWEKHQDKVTVAGGAAAGALLGAIVGGKKGAAIGALAGAGGGALYTYKIRNRNRYPY